MILDAGVWLAASNADSPHHAASRQLVLSGSVRSLDLTAYEIANVAVRVWGSAARAHSLAQALFRACGDRLIRVDGGLAAEAITAASELGLSGYDAAYYAASRRFAEPLVSLDLRDLVEPGHAITPEQALA